MAENSVGLAFDDVTVKYRRSPEPALRQVTFAAGRGINFLIGPNGAGKTTSMRAILGEVPLAAGAISLNGQHVDAALSRTRQTAMGYCPQEFDLPKSVLAHEYVAYLARLRGFARGEIDELASSALERVGLSDKSRMKLGALSGGQKRRIGIAQAILGRPKVVLLDEPTAGLDPESRIGLRGIIAKLAAESAIVFASHLAEDIDRLPGSVILLRRGEVAFRGEKSELLQYAEGTDDYGSPLERAIAEISRQGREV